MSDDLRLVSREEVQVLFGVTPQRMKAWLDDAGSGVPVVYVTSVPQFQPSVFLRWLVSKFGRGDWSGVVEVKNGGNAAGAAGVPVPSVVRPGRLVGGRNGVRRVRPLEGEIY